MIEMDVKYKKTGNEWVPEIPEHWDFRRLKNFALIASGQDQKGIENDNGKYSIYGTGGLMGKTDRFLYEGPSVILGRKGTIDSPFYLTEPFWTVDTAYYTIIKDNVDPRFFFYCCLTIEFDFYKYGSAVPSMSQRDLNQIRLPYPPLQEQQAIADFLDAKCKGINYFLETKQRFIALLKEQRQSIITHAVTKGIDENVKMKDSGTEWLGEVPEHWEVRRLKNCIKGKLRYGANESGELYNPSWYRYIRITDFNNDGKLDEQNKLSLLPEVGKEYELKDGDILFARSGATVGKTFQFRADNPNEKYCYAGYLIRAEADESVMLSDFLYEYTNSKAFDNWKNSIFSKATIENISADKYCVLRVPVPTVVEQQTIINYIRTETKTLDIAIGKAEKEIELMKEYREAMIAEAITGRSNSK